MLDLQTLREALPGEWRVLATTFPMWLSGRRLQPMFRYGLLADEPLTFSDEVTYRTRGGATKRILGVDRFDPATGAFTWRGRGLLRPLSSRWRVEHLSDDRNLIVLSFARSLVTPAGVDVVGRGGGDHPNAREHIPAEALVPELHWLS
ncbi:hypothetical protein Cs7R123_46850 [Catellatospora sp. TT07R-123]|uniref:hypothetical protein n=1 Tax=Catellatospora sp. TT07R-123 TaxID=2733863 RepID=UPI001B1DA7CF|nr:hypothetical protein [Catellatospora sp. TT07R-123]GHJ47343.1 hypothetical protein Cs7R123_46850 [Catellatospora sp. TT07R-123]